MDRYFSQAARTKACTPSVSSATQYVRRCRDPHNPETNVYGVSRLMTRDEAPLQTKGPFPYPSVHLSICPYMHIHASLLLSYLSHFSTCVRTPSCPRASSRVPPRSQRPISTASPSWRTAISSNLKYRPPLKLGSRAPWVIEFGWFRLVG